MAPLIAALLLLCALAPGSAQTLFNQREATQSGSDQPGSDQKCKGRAECLLVACMGKGGGQACDYIATGTEYEGGTWKGNMIPGSTWVGYCQDNVRDPFGELPYKGKIWCSAKPVPVTSSCKTPAECLVGACKGKPKRASCGYRAEYSIWTGQCWENNDAPENGQIKAVPADKLYCHPRNQMVRPPPSPTRRRRQVRRRSVPSPTPPMRPPTRRRGYPVQPPRTRRRTQPVQPPRTRRRSPPPTRPPVSLSSISAQLNSLQGTIGKLLPLRNDIKMDLTALLKPLNKNILSLDGKISGLSQKIDKLAKQCQPPSTPAPAPPGWGDNDNNDDDNDDNDNDDNNNDNDDNDNDNNDDDDDNNDDDNNNENDTPQFRPE